MKKILLAVMVVSWLVGGAAAMRAQEEAAESAPKVLVIDREMVKVGKGAAGPITRKLQEEFFAITSGSKADRHNWLTPVNAPVAAGR